MTNFEKWKDEIATIRSGGHCVAVVNGEPVKCISFCNSCDFKGCPCVGKLIDWLLAEYKEPAPKLTKREREFLETFSVMDKAIKRDRLLYLHCNTYKGGFDFSIRPQLFPFIKNGESWTFEELMELEVE